MKPPHLIIVNVDSFRGDVLGHLGNSAAFTPNVDALVKDGAVSYRQAHCQASVCVPSRCSFMSGQYAHVFGHRTMAHARHVERGQSYLLPELRAAGYHVWWGGKNDLVPGDQDPSEHADVYFRPGPDEMARLGLKAHALTSESTWRGEPGDDRYYGFLRGVIPGLGPDEVRVDGDFAVVKAAVEYLENYRGEKPLCLFLALSVPHPQYAVEPRFYQAIDPAKLPARTAPEKLVGPEPAFRRLVRERQNLSGWSEERWTELKRVYYAMCARADHLFGEVVGALKRRAMYDDAAIFFFSDHGDYTGDFGLVEKSQNTFEDCLTRVPLVIKPPAGVACTPGVRDELVELIDFTATAYDFAGVQPGYDHFGRSLRASIAGEAGRTRDAVFCEGGRLAHEDHCCEKESGAATERSNKYWPKVSAQQEMPAHGKAVMSRTKEFKYVRRPFEEDQLFDLRSDPQEAVNRIHDPALAAELAELRMRMLDWTILTADVVPRKLDARGFYKPSGASG